eukprot:jgi/Psemu1/18888/gm1.18888_g
MLVAFAPSCFGFIARFCNQIMALTILVMQAAEYGHSGLLLDMLWHKDTYGIETCDPFDFYFDVAHWNNREQQQQEQQQREQRQLANSYLNYNNKHCASVIQGTGVSTPSELQALICLLQDGY